MNLIKNAIKNRLITITQEPELKQLIGAGKGVQMPIYVNIFGDKAIKQAAAFDGDLFASILYILECLPEPRLLNLKILAMAAAKREFISFRKASSYLGICCKTMSDQRRPYFEAIKAIEDGTLIFQKEDQSGPKKEPDLLQSTANIPKSK